MLHENNSVYQQVMAYTQVNLKDVVISVGLWDN